MKLSNTALRELSAKYKDILKKCAIFNAAILMGVMVAAPAGAEYTPVEERLVLTASDEDPDLKGVSFSDFSITSSAAGYGAAVNNAGTLTISDSLFENNSSIYNAAMGGAIYNSGTLTVTGTDFIENFAQGSNQVRGGVLYNKGTTTIDKSNFVGNYSSITEPGWKVYGGVAQSEGKMTVSNSTFKGNTAPYMASVFYNSNDLTLIGNTFGGKDEGDSNGTLDTSIVYHNGAILNVVNNTFENNLGGVINAGSSAEGNTVNFYGENTFSGTTGTGSEASPVFVYNLANPIVTFSNDSYEYNEVDYAENGGVNTFTNNTATAGGAIRTATHANSAYKDDVATVVFASGTTNTFEENTATTKGGAIYNEQIMTFESGSTTTFSGNTADEEGGAIYNAVGAEMNILGTAIFSGNTAGGVANDIYNAGTLYIGGDITLDAGIIGSGSVYFDDGATLTGQLLNSTTPLIDVASLNVGEDVKAYLTFDIGDVESETWKYAQADEWEGNDFVLSLDPNPLYDVVAGEEKGTITVSRRPTQDIVDDMTEAGASENEASAMAAVAGVNNTGDEVVDSIISSMKELIQEGKIEEAKELAGKINPTEAPVQQAISASSAVMGAVTNRMSVAGSTPAPAVGRSGGDWNDDNSPNPITNLSPWIQGLYNKTHNSQGLGFDAYSKGFAFGADTRLNDAWTVGLGYAYTATDIKNSQRKMQVYGDNYFVYGQYKPSNWYVSAVASMGKADYKDKSVLTSTYDVDTYAGQLMAGYQKGLFDNYAGFRYTFVKSDAYDNGLTSVKAKNTNLGTAVIGTKVSKDFTCKKGVTWTPEFRLAGSYDVMSKASKATVGIIGSTSTYSVTGERLSRAALETGVSLKAKVKDFELVGGYDVELRSQNNTQAVNLKAIYHF